MGFIEPVRFGILGLGVGYSKAKQCTQSRGAILSAVCDLQEDRARKIAEEFKCRWYTDYDKMLEKEDIDCVGVFTPSGMHMDHALKAIRRGLHVFVTKPMDIDAEKCRLAIKEAEEANVVLAVDFELRYQPLNQKIYYAIQQNLIGRVFLVDVLMKWFRDEAYYKGGYPPGWRSSRLYEGGSAANQGIHFIDLVQWWMGGVDLVQGLSGTFTHNIETEDCSVAVLRFKNGAFGTLTTTTSSIPNLGTRIEVNSDRGSLIWKDGKLDFFYLKDGDQSILDSISLPEDRPLNIFEDMVAAIRKGTKPIVDGREGLKSVLILNAIYESSKTGKAVKIEEV
ncbi:Gfo/Idh/MocA family oxidoreductase [Candidatus Bathyarchaeota archaeon]|nr:Gfo/Idh/MocA family oxidoreductase [Candidatus Bathyarchaeota archaeon]